jgi:DNA-binding FadR family transcriptional regulator
MRQVLRDHKAITEAVAEGAPDQAQALLRDHLSNSLAFVDTLKIKHPEYFRA